MDKLTKLAIEMVFVQGGTFKMGNNDNDSFLNTELIHYVQLDDFYIGKYEVTQKQWTEITGNNPSSFNRDNLPVENVSWYDVQKFIKKLEQKTGEKYRLPTEAEWEYAARGGKRSKSYKYSGSNNVDEVAWNWHNSENRMHPVGYKLANELGLYDMSGNVWEWCNDWYSHEYYKKCPSNNPKGPSLGTERVCRGGSWDDYDQLCHSYFRNSHYPDDRRDNLGFRLALAK